MNAITTFTMLTLILAAQQAGFKPERFIATADLRFNATASIVFTMFEPIGEKQWAQGWDPAPVYPDDIRAAAGTVFTTHTKHDQSIWTITHYESGKAIEYSVVTPSHDTTQILIACKPAGSAATDVSVTYRITGMSEMGNQFGREHASHFPAIMDHWRERISEALKKH